MMTTQIAPPYYSSSSGCLTTPQSQTRVIVGSGGNDGITLRQGNYAGDSAEYVIQTSSVVRRQFSCCCEEIKLHPNTSQQPFLARPQSRIRRFQLSLCPRSLFSNII